MESALTVPQKETWYCLLLACVFDSTKPIAGVFPWEGPGIDADCREAEVYCPRKSTGLHVCSGDRGCKPTPRPASSWFHLREAQSSYGLQGQVSFVICPRVRDGLGSRTDWVELLRAEVAEVAHPGSMD